MEINTPGAFLDYIKNSKFDYSSIRAWEVETVSSYLRLTDEDQKKLIAYIKNREDHEILNKNTLVKIGRNSNEEIDIEVSASQVEKLNEHDFEQLLEKLESAKFRCVGARKGFKNASPAKRTVATWPKWKQELADQVFRPSKKP